MEWGEDVRLFDIGSHCVVERNMAQGRRFSSVIRFIRAIFISFLDYRLIMV